jgi:hypothetical protein
MTKYFEKGKWLLQYENDKYSFNILAFYKERTLFWIRRSKSSRYCEFEVMGKNLIYFKY